MSSAKLWDRTVGVLFVLSVASGNVKAQSRVEEEVRLAQLTKSAFECSAVSPEQGEERRLFEIGMATGRKFLDELNKLTEGERSATLEKSLKNDKEFYWGEFIWAGRFAVTATTDFILGRVYENRMEEARKHYDIGGDQKAFDLKIERMYGQKNCSLIR